MGERRQERGQGSRTEGDVESRKLYARVTEKLFGVTESVPVHIDRYRVLEKLGQGAMGVVYAAIDEQLGRKVALKVLHPVSSGDATGRARLLREAQAMARLRHDNVVQVYDVGTHAPGSDSEQVFVAMELAAGVTLDVWLRAAPRPWSAVLAVFVQAGRALSAAHAAGVLHRDFKPENVLVDPSGRARVLDFGLARALADADADAGDSLSTPLTKAGSILGTPAYMAPEQLRGERTGAQADQFSFCVALYEGLYGERPFAGVPRFDEVRVTHVPKDSRIPDALRRAILRGLAHDPADRYVDMDALLAALPGPGAQRRPLLVAAAALLGCAGVGLGAWRLVGMSAQIDTLGLELAQSRLAAQQRAGPAPAVAVAAPPRARRVDLARLIESDPTSAVLVLRACADDPAIDVASLTRQVLIRPVARAIVPAPGAVAVGFTAAGGLWLVDAGGLRRFDEHQVALPDDPEVAHALHERHAQAIAGARPGADFAALADAAHQDRDEWPGPDGKLALRRDHAGRLFLARVRLADHDGPVSAVAWTAAGDRVAVASDAIVRVWDRRGRLLATVAGHEGSLSLLAWSPTGEQLLAGGDDHHARVFRPGSVDPGAHRVLRGHAGPISAIAWHPAGDQVATASDDGTVRVWTLVPAARARFDHPPAVQDLAWAPDGGRLASAGDDGRIRLFDPAAPAAPPVIFGEARSTLSLAWTAAPEPRLASAGGDTTVRVWSAAGVLQASLPTGARRGEDTLAVAWAADGLLAAGNEDRVLWFPGGAGDPQVVAGLRGPLLELAFGPGGEQLAATTVAGEAHRWQIDRSTGVPQASAPLGSGVNDLAWCGADVVVARDDRRVEVVPADGPAPPSYRVPVAATGVACDPRGSVVAAGLADGQLRVWTRSAALGEPPLVLRGHTAAVDVVAFTAAGDELATGDTRGRIYLWPHSDSRWAAALVAATAACLTADRREALLGESGEAARAAAAGCLDVTP